MFPNWKLLEGVSELRRREERIKQSLHYLWEMQRFAVENINELIVLLAVWASSRWEPKSVISSVSAERQEKIEDEETDRNKMFGGYSLNSAMIFPSPASKQIVPISEAAVEKNGSTSLNKFIDWGIMRNLFFFFFISNEKYFKLLISIWLWKQVHKRTIWTKNNEKFARKHT